MVHCRLRFWVSPSLILRIVSLSKTTSRVSRSSANLTVAAQIWVIMDFGSFTVSVLAANGSHWLEKWTDDISSVLSGVMIPLSHGHIFSLPSQANERLDNFMPKARYFFGHSLRCTELPTVRFSLIRSMAFSISLSRYLSCMFCEAFSWPRYFAKSGCLFTSMRRFDPVA